jgi:formylglycine-generating enzyme
MKKNTAIIFPLCLFIACNNHQNNNDTVVKDSAHSCMNVPSRFAGTDSLSHNIMTSGDTSNSGMILISGGTFDVGADNNQASPDEYPKHTVRINSFYIDVTEVANGRANDCLQKLNGNLLPEAA